MILSLREAEQFYKIWWQLLAFVNNKFSISREFNKQVQRKKVQLITAAPIRDKLWDDDSLLESFVSENYAKLSDDDLGIAASWKHRITGNFFIYKYLEKHTIFLDDKTPAHAYGIHGILCPIQDVLISPLPIHVKAVLLPFKDKIIYDSLINCNHIHFSSGFRSDLSFKYKNAIERYGTITSLIPYNSTLTAE